MNYEELQISQIINEVIEKTDCFVVIKDKESFLSKINDPEAEELFGMCKNIGGLFLSLNTTKNIYPNNFIYINNSNSLIIQLYCLYHEIEHYNCWKNNCNCRYSNDKSEVEFCAFLNSGKEILSSHYDDNIKYQLLHHHIEQIDKKINKKSCWYYYIKACEKVHSTLSYKECELFVENYEKMVLVA